MIHYVHCKLKKDCGDYGLQTYSWLPEQFAKIGTILELKMDGKWIDGWMVVSTFGRVHEDIFDYAHRKIPNE